MITPPSGSGFRLVRYFTVASLIAFVLVAAPLMYLGRMAGDFFANVLLEQEAFFERVQDSFAKKQRESAQRDLLTVHEADSVNLTRLFSNALWEKDFAPFVAKAQRVSDIHCRSMADVVDAGGKAVRPDQKKACFAEIGKSIMAFPEFRAIDARVYDTMKNSSVFKIKVYDLRGITVYSSEHGQIGEDQTANAGWQSALAGKPASALIHRDEFNGFDGVFENRDLIEIYLPVTTPESENIVGVLEVYSDVTSFLEQINSASNQIQKIAAENQLQLESAMATNAVAGGKNANLLLATVLGLLVLLYFALYLIVRHGQRTIDNQNIERERMEQALRESEARFRSLSELSSDWYWEQDEEFRFIDASSRVRDRLRNDPNLGKTLWELPVVGVSEERLATHRACLEGHRPFRKFEYAVRSRRGELTHVSASGEPIFDEQGAFKGYRGIGRDITASKQAEAARATLEAQKTEAIETLAGGIAREFNNAVATILGNVELARQDIGANPVALESLEEIHHAGTRSRDLVQQILAYSRKQPLQLVNQPIRPLVEEAVRLLRDNLPAGVELVTSIADVSARVLADSAQVQQVLLELCANSWHALHERVGRIELGLEEVTLDQAAVLNLPDLKPGAHVKLRVSDNGKGMDAATQMRIFEPFFTTKPAGQGTGLSLAAVHGIVKTHAGTITVHSAPGRGTTMQVYFPVAAAPQVEMHATPAKVETLRGRGQGQHVLYVDDDEPLVFLVTRMLDRLGYRTSGYHGARSALDAVRADPGSFDLVVTDFNMPGLTGLDVAQELARIRPDLPVVITSGHITDAMRADALQAGVRAFIYKPNTVDELCEAVARYAITQSANSCPC
jgi:PAS domain S-box-containing protein